MPFESTVAAFAAALCDPAAPPPAAIRGRRGAPDARRFAVYRNNVAVGLIGALEARYPVARRIVGPEAFRAMARAFVEAHKPRSPVLIAYGAVFPDFIEAQGPNPDLRRLADVARLENAWVEAYHAEDAPAAGLADLAALSAEALPNARDRAPPGGAASQPRDAGRLDLGVLPGRRRADRPARARRRRARRAPESGRVGPHPAARRLCSSRSGCERARRSPRRRPPFPTLTNSEPTSSAWSPPAP